jgi:hypothetical protein
LINALELHNNNGPFIRGASSSRLRRAIWLYGCVRSGASISARRSVFDDAEHFWSRRSSRYFNAE